MWDTEVVPLLRRDRNGKLQAKTVLKALRRQHPERCTKGQLRTLHRRVRDWRALVHLVRAQANPFPHVPAGDGRAAAGPFGGLRPDERAVEQGGRGPRVVTGWAERATLLSETNRGRGRAVHEAEAPVPKTDEGRRPDRYVARWLPAAGSARRASGVRGQQRAQRPAGAFLVRLRTGTPGRRVPVLTGHLA